eukprot:TRINITY_DN5978_c0_g1_i4.p1 TRINITY_DN5978_c0_g1~~TRINITY_DN5978_c0_g1_i4.p1  ORF type:complete len:132 (-),score=21.31 TRINITY_DN5978_c0_g1_i4:515-910(-)
MVRNSSCSSSFLKTLLGIVAGGFADSDTLSTYYCSNEDLAAPPKLLQAVVPQPAVLPPPHMAPPHMMTPPFSKSGTPSAPPPPGSALVGKAASAGVPKVVPPFVNPPAAGPGQANDGQARDSLISAWYGGK